MQLKRLLSLLCAVVLILTAAIVPVSATETESFEVGVEVYTDTPISDNPMIIQAGDNVSVRISALNNPGISVAAIELRYNTEAVELDYTVDNDLFDGISYINEYDGNVRYNVITNFNSSHTFDIVYDEGFLFEANFVIKEDFDGELEFEVALKGDNHKNCVAGSSNNFVPFVGGEVAFDVHDIVGEGIVIAPTCTEEGYTTYACANHDGEVIGNITEPTGHSPAEAVVENTEDATCTENGSYDSVVYCATCGAELSRETMVIDATGHTPAEAVVENTVAATCTENGSYDTVVYCSICGAELERENIVVNATGHTPAEEEIENVVEATCTSVGSYDTVVYCSVCDAELSREAHEVEMLPHTSGDPEIENRVEATCTEAGSYDEVTYCEVCRTVLHTNSVVVPAAGHTSGDAVIENNVEATCTEAGSYDSVVYCTVCNEELSREAHEVEMLPHTPGKCAIENLVEATCTETGSYNEVTYCDVCHNVIDTNAVVVPVMGHTPAEAVVENAVEATCTEAGSYESVVYCSVCKAEISRETVVVDALGHTLVDHEAQAATCTEIGWEAYQTCEVCDYTTYVEIAATGHTAGGKWTVTVKPTYEAEGERVLYCTVCNEVAVTEVMSVVNKVPFEDVKAGAWYEEGIEYCYNKGYISGVTATTFCPNNSLTREQFVLILANVDGVDLAQYADKNSPFTDVKDGAWYENAIVWAYENKYSSGTSETTFGVGAKITREQLARFFYVYAEANGYDVSGKADLAAFTDAGTISAWALTPVQWAVNEGIISGMTATTIVPRGTATRAQAARMFMVFDEFRNV